MKNDFLTTVNGTSSGKDQITYLMIETPRIALKNPILKLCDKIYTYIYI